VRLISSECRTYKILGGTYVALSADHLVAVEFGSESLKRWLDDTTTETENEMES
jgi:hypothetical protein